MRSNKGYLYYLLPLLFLFFFCLLPLLYMISHGILDQNGRPTLEYIIRLLDDRIYRSVIWFTIWQAALSSLIVLVLAFPGAYLLSRYDFPGKRAVMAVTTVPFVIPSLVLAVGMIALFSRGGNVNQLIDLLNGASFLDIPHLEILGRKPAIILAHVFFNFPIALRFLTSRFNGLDWNLVKASRSLGASRIRTFVRVVIPQMRYSIISSLSLVFTFCFLTFGIVLLIGGLNHTIEVEVRALFIGLSDEKISLSGAFILIETAIVMASTMVYVWSSSREKGGSELSYLRRVPNRRRPRPLQGSLIGIYAVIVVLVIFSPLLVIFLGSFFTGEPFSSQLTSRWYESVFEMHNDASLSVTPFRAIKNSLLFGFMTMVLSVPLSYFTARAMMRKGGTFKKTMDMFLLFPLGASAVGLGYGLVSAYSAGPVKLTGTWYLIVIVHSILAYPIGARAIYSSMRSVPRELMLASRSLGASPLETFMRVELPLIMPGVLVAAVFAFAVSIGEFGATLMVYSEELTTMPVYLFRTIEGGGRQLGPMYAYSVVLILITFLSFLSIEMVQRYFSKWGLKDGS